MSNWSDKYCYLATTALTQYWDTSKPLLLLSPACLRYSQKPQYEKFTYKLLPDPWEAHHALLAARDYVEQLHARLLPELAAVLNHIHDTNHSVKYWNILLGPWLRIYLAVFYDRYTSLRVAYATNNNLHTVALTQDSFAIAKTPQEFSSFLLTDIFNLQLYSFILDYENAETKKITVNVRDKIGIQKKPEVLKNRVKNYLRRCANTLFLKMGHKDKVVFSDSGVSFYTLLKLFYKSRFHIVPVTYFGKSPDDFVIDWEHRRQFLRIHLTNADFEKCLIHSFAYFLPASFIENYAQYNQIADKIPISPEVIFSAMGWHYNEPFKHFAARAQEQGTVLVGHQHGGDYGILDYHSSEIHERKITDHYFTWGWDSQHDKAIKPFHGLKLRETQHKATAKPKAHYLYGTANGRRYLLRFNFATSAVLSYFAFQKTFIQALSPQLQAKLRLRLYPSDWGWDRELRWQEINTTLQFQSASIPFTNALSACQLYIADHISTTFAESLAINKPTFIVCDPQMWGIREEAQPYFEQLQRVGILHQDPIVAAKALDTIDKDVSAWWQEPERQRVVQLFRERFCRIASDNLTEWVNELLAIAKHSH